MTASRRLVYGSMNEKRHEDGAAVRAFPPAVPALTIFGAPTPVCAWVSRRFAIVPEQAYLEHKLGAEHLGSERRARRRL